MHGFTAKENGLIFVTDVKSIVKHCKFNPISVNEVAVFVVNVNYYVDPVPNSETEICIDWVNELSTKTQD